MYLSLVSVNVVAPQERFVAYVAAVALPLRGVHGEVDTTYYLPGGSPTRPHFT